MDKVYRETLTRDIIPIINGHLSKTVSRRDVARVVEKVAGRKRYGAANHVLKILRVIFGWAVCTGRVDVDPTARVKRFPSKPRERVLSDEEIRAAWNARTDFRLAFRVQLLLGLRIGEVVHASKAEVDLAQNVWVIPASRTKSHRTV